MSLLPGIGFKIIYYYYFRVHDKRAIHPATLLAWENSIRHMHIHIEVFECNDTFFICLTPLLNFVIS